ncbi:hypothetical protein BJX63DRAFT_431016 [Aspergillus granulosus]|uniref:Nucleoside phosphorylase domain-containing protein n=1 Tax=Aspergillus granulosus TaxID=176169 RepID=A0ABR4HI91_9EURO
MARNHDDYTVGWICALPRELAAARGMLDEEHEALPLDATDCSAYTLGRIATHNVVLACLPVGETGVVPAAITVMRMKTTFRNLEVGLLVGVGGGIPSEKHDIRLGDVVVGDSGVIQYDMGKTVQGGRFICTQPRSHPPQVTLLAVSNLQAGHRLGKQKMTDYIDDMTNRYPGFSHPGIGSDVLFHSDYDHPEGTASCEGCDFAHRIFRKARPSTRPVVHYGLIASGNRVMRHGATRDELRAEHDILCFEMEAAGLMSVFPSLVIRGICDYADSHKSKVWQDYAAVTAAAYAKELLGIIPGPLMRPMGPCFMVPFLSAQKFVGREKILSMIDQKVEAKQPVILAGMGGVGKTQIAVQYCYAYREKVPTAKIFWVHASSRATFEQSYCAIARALRISGYEDPGVNVGFQVRERLSNQNAGRWLMVLDNLDDGEELASQMVLIPSTRLGAGSIIVTTRDMRVANYLPEWDHVDNDIIPVPPLGMTDARSLLEELLRPEQRRNEADLMDLLQMLGCFPLALTQAIAFIKQYRTTVTNYKNLLYQGNRSRPNAVLEIEYCDIRRYGEGPDSVYRTWGVCFMRIQREEPAAAELLAYISMFDAPLGVPEGLLCTVGYDGLTFTTALGTLSSFSMITMGQDDSPVMHPMVQQAVREFLSRQNCREKYQKKSLDLMTSVFPDARAASWQLCDQLVPHAEEVLQYVFESEDSRKATLLGRATLLHNVAAYKCHRGWYPMALVQAQEAHNIRLNILGGASLDTLASLELAALIQVNQGQHRNAETKQRAVLDARQNLAPADDILIVESQQALADILLRTGQLTEAIALYERALATSQATRGARCQSSLELMDRLGEALEQQDRLKDAERMYRQALIGKEMTLTAEHDSTIKTKISLNVLLARRSDHEHAYKLLCNAIQLSTKTFGEKHPDTIRLLCNLAGLYFMQGKWQAADEVQMQAHCNLAEVLGENHPSTLVCRSNLAVFKQVQGEYAEAEEMHRDLYHRRSTILGHQHPYTLTSIYHLAEVLVERKEYDEARGLFEQVLAGRQQTLGSKHPDTLRCMSSLASLLDDLGHFDEAERLYIKSLQVKREVLPADHVEIATDMNNLAEVLRQSDKLSEAESWHRQVLQLCANPGNEFWTVSRANLGRVLYQQGRYDEAVDLYQEALAASEATESDQSAFIQMVSKRLEVALNDRKESQQQSGVYEWLRWMATGPMMRRIWAKS